MSYIDQFRKQKAVYWERTGHDGYEPTFASATEIDVRWVDKWEMFVDADGEEKISRSMVIVGEDMSVGDYLSLCELTDLDSDETDVPMNRSTAYKIRSFEKIPSVDGDEFLRRAIL